MERKDAEVAHLKATANPAVTCILPWAYLAFLLEGAFGGSGG